VKRCTPGTWTRLVRERRSHLRAPFGRCVGCPRQRIINFRPTSSESGIFRKDHAQLRPIAEGRCASSFRKSGLNLCVETAAQRRFVSRNCASDFFLFFFFFFFPFKMMGLTLIYYLSSNRSLFLFSSLRPPLLSLSLSLSLARSLAHTDFNFRSVRLIRPQHPLRFPRHHLVDSS